MKFQTVKLGDIAVMKYGKMPPKDLLCEDGFPVFSGYRVTGSCKEYLYSIDKNTPG
jgi:type I restriction enzyme S subunit